MARFANIPQTVKAVFPMNQKFIRGTGINPEVESKLEAIGQGLKTTTTNAAKQDLYAMNRLSPGDDIAFYNPEGDVSFAKYQSNAPVPQEIFYPDTFDARRQYGAGEGGNSRYTNLTLFGGFDPEVIPLDQPFSPGRGYKPALSGNSQVMKFSDTTPTVNFATLIPDGERLIPQGVIQSKPITDRDRALAATEILSKANPKTFVSVPASNYDSSLAGTFDRLPPQIANKIRQRKQYEEQYADTGFYKDSYVNWRQSPIRNQQGASPYFEDNLADAEYSPELMAASGYVLDDNGNYQKVMWENKGKNGGVVGEIYIDGEKQPVVGNPGNIDNYKPVFINPNYVNYAFKNPEKYGITAPRSQYQNLGVSGTDNKGKPLYKFQRNDIPFENTPIKSSRIQNADQELYSVNQLINGVGIGDVKEVYHGNPGELGYDAIQQLGRSGGSGRWVDDISPEDDYNLFNLNGSSSQANQMLQNDLERGGGIIGSIYDTQLIPNNYGNPSVIWDRPDLMRPFINGVDKVKVPIGVERNNRRNPLAQTPIEQNEYGGKRFISMNSTPSQQVPEFAGGIAFNERGIPVDIPGHQVPPGYQNLSPASELLESAPQYRFNQPRNIARLNEESQLPPLTQLNPYFVNDYGVIQKSYITNKAPLSVQQYNGTLDNSQMANRGRWVGGGIMDEGRTRTASSNDPLDSNYQIRLPKEIAFKPELERSDPRLKEAWNRQQQALQQAALTTEEKFIPYQKDYDIEYSANQIPGDIPRQAIEGAYLPALVQNPFVLQQAPGSFEPSYHPYTPDSNLLDQHLADVKIKLGNQYYPLTREATTLQYLPSEKQAAQANQEMYAKRKIYNDGRIEEFEYGEIPDDTMVASAKNNSVYANPDIDGSLDIVGALDKEQQHINALTTIAEQKLPYNISQGQGIKLIDDYGSGKIDMQLLANNPMMAMHQMVNVVPKDNYQPNTLRDSVLYGRSVGTKYKYPELDGLPISAWNNDGTSRYDTPLPSTVRTSSNQDSATIGKSILLNRIINEEEAARIQQRMTVRPRVQREVMTDDGTSYWEDIDGQGIYQKDLEGIIDNPNKKLSYDEVLQLLDQKTADYQTAKNAYTQLMNLEPQDEIRINATAKKPQKLADQLQQYGLSAEVDGNDIYARGSLRAGLPGENIPNLPVQRFKQEETDPEIAEMVALGKATNQIINIGNVYKNQLAQDRRMEEIGYPSVTQYLQPEDIQSRIINQAKRNAMLDRKADTSGDRLAQMLTAQDFNLTQLPQPSSSRNPLMNANASESNTIVFPNEINATFSNPLIRGSYTPSPLDDPAEIELHQLQQAVNQPRQQLDLSQLPQPGSVRSPLMRITNGGDRAVSFSDETSAPFSSPLTNRLNGYDNVPKESPEALNPRFNQLQPESVAQNNRWLRPGLIGAGLIGGSGLSLYYQQQQKQQQEDERQMRAYKI